MTLRRLPDSEQYVNRPRCPDPEHNPPGFVDTSVVKPGSYVHACPTCGNEVRIEVSEPVMSNDAHTGAGR